MNLLKALVFLFFFKVAFAHPAPDIPIKTYFTDLVCRIQIEIEPRCFSGNYNDIPYTTKSDFDKLTDADKKSLFEKSDLFIQHNIIFNLKPKVEFKPKFNFKFQTLGGGNTELAEDSITILAYSETKLDGTETKYQVTSSKEIDFSLVVMNYQNDELDERIHTLFPAESSYILELQKSISDDTSKSAKEAKSSSDRWFTFIQFLKQGFLHVLPLGLDHILFVLGLFLLSRKIKPLLLQVSVFTIAHTITLALSTLGHISLPGNVVEPIIAASLAFIAIENIFKRSYSHKRLILVGLFGLIHGMGFAGALSDLNLPQSLLIIGLLAFNIGVEFGQIAIIALAFILTIPFKREDIYRKTIVIPFSLLIAMMGIYWTLERVGLL